MNIQIIPSMLTHSEQEFVSQLKQIQRTASKVQIDIADGKFTPNTTWADPSVIAEHLEIDAELHLMVQDPLLHIEKWEDVQHIQRVIIHAESVPHAIDELLSEVEQRYEYEIFLAIKPSTTIDMIRPFLDRIVGILFLGVEPGKQGQAFQYDVLNKIKSFKDEETGHVLSLDGGVNLTTLADIVSSGVDEICPGSAIFHANIAPSDAYLEMQSQLSILEKR